MQLQRQQSQHVTLLNERQCEQIAAIVDQTSRQTEQMLGDGQKERYANREIVDSL